MVLCAEMIIQADKIITLSDRIPPVAGAIVIKYGRIMLSVMLPQ